MFIRTRPSRFFSSLPSLALRVIVFSERQVLMLLVGLILVVLVLINRFLHLPNRRDFWQRRGGIFSFRVFLVWIHLWRFSCFRILLSSVSWDRRTWFWVIVFTFGLWVFTVRVIFEWCFGVLILHDRIIISQVMSLLRRWKYQPRGPLELRWKILLTYWSWRFLASSVDMAWVWSEISKLMIEISIKKSNQLNIN